MIELLLVAMFSTNTVNGMVQQWQEISAIEDHMLNPDRELAVYTYEAAKAYQVDHILLTELINSESSYNINIKHSLDYVVGLSGINTRYWDLPVETPEEQIHAGAYVLGHYLDKYTDTIEALTRYKGKSELGRRQAKLVYAQYIQSLKEIQ